MTSKKYLTLKAEPESSLGKTIAYIQSSPINNQGLAVQTLQTRFFPFVVDRNDPKFYETAIQCAIECEAWGRMIREYAGLSTPSNSVTSSLPQHSPLPSPTVDSFGHSSLPEATKADLDVDDEEIEDDEYDEEYESRMAFAKEMMGELS
jgi:hypothetical protein